MKTTPTHVLGTDLSPDQQDHALRAYVHRFTGDHKPRWADKPMPGGGAYPLQFKDDRDWLAHTTFPTIKGKIISGHGADSACHSTPTWPGRPDLRKRPS